MNVNLVAGTYSIIINNTETVEVKINNIIIHSKITENPDLVKYYRMHPDSLYVCLMIMEIQ